MIAFVLVHSDHGALIVNRFDYNSSFSGQIYGVGAQILDRGTYDPGEVETLRSLLVLVRRYRGDGVVALDCGEVVIVHGCTPDALVVDRKAAGLDDVERDAQAGGQANESAEILRYIGLVESESHRFPFHRRPRRGKPAVRQGVTD